ncbi:hypothetical protein BKP42_67890 [Rhodococcus erythropolis]|nr:hypothetical protein BKP42_67890 [Rhodococcus erythropolis]
MDDHHGLGNTVTIEQCRLDLTELDAQTAELDLKVGAADVFELAVRSDAAPAHQISGSIHPRSVGSARPSHEAVCREIRSRHVSSGQLNPGKIELSCHSRRRRPERVVEHQELGVCHGRADRHRHLISLTGFVVRHVDGSFGRAVQIVEFSTADLAQTCRGPSRQRLTGSEHVAKGFDLRDKGFGNEHCEHRRHEVHRRHPALDHRASHVRRITMSVRFCDHQRCTDLQRPEELPHGHVESERCLLQDHVVGSESVLGLAPLQVRDDGTVRDCNAFGASG